MTLQTIVRNCIVPIALLTTVRKNYKGNLIFVKILSHDVVSLFTNTPINETLDIFKKQLEVDTKLNLQTNLNVDDIIELLKFIVTTNILASGAPFISRSLAQQWEVRCHL